MAHTNVSSCVLSILSSFSSGLDVFRKLRESRGAKKSRRSKAEQRRQEEEVLLSRSLRRGPEDIAREYEKSLHAAGDQFAIGDAIAQTSLAEILLRLNTGLVTIIASFLDRDKRDVQLDYPALTNLSERSRVDTCRALRQLYKRMSQLHGAPAAIPAQSSEHRTREYETHVEHKRKKKSSPKHAKIRGPTLARIVIKDSSRPSQIALVKPGERRKRFHSSSASGSSSLSKAHSQASTALTTPLPSPPPPYDTQERPTRPTAQRSNTSPELPKPRRKPSAVNVKSPPVPPKPEALRSTRSTPRLHNGIDESYYEPLPPMPHTAPLPRMEGRVARKPTPTYYSIASDSTKLGEIPLHKWAVPFDFDAMSLMNREAEHNGWPGNPLETADEGKKKPRFGLFRMFRR